MYKKRKRYALGDYFGVEAGKKIEPYGQVGNLLGAGIDFANPTNQYESKE